jgi:hypothetical protein
MTGRTSNIKQVPSKCIDPFLLTYHQPFNTLHLHAKVDLVLKRVTAIPVNQADVKKKNKKNLIRLCSAGLTYLCVVWLMPSSARWKCAMLLFLIRNYELQALSSHENMVQTSDCMQFFYFPPQATAGTTITWSKSFYHVLKIKFTSSVPLQNMFV